MRKILDVNLHRKIRRKRKIKQYFKISFLFLCIFLGVFVVWNISLKKIIFGAKNENFPILFSGDSVLGFQKTKTGFCVLTNNQFNFYKDDGEKIRNVVKNSLKTRIDSKGDNILLFEKGSKNFSVQNEKKEIFSDILKNPIIFGKFFDKGYAFVTKSEDYLCELVVYNKKNEQIYKWSCAESLIIDFDISNDFKSCVVVTFGTKEGFFRSFIYELKFSDNSEKFKKDFLKQTPLAIKKFGSIVVFVCENNVFFLDGNKNIINSVNFGKNLNNFELVDSGYLICCFSGLDENNFCENVVSYDRMGNKIAEFKINEKVRKIKSFGSDVLILTDENIMHTNVNLRDVKKIKSFGEMEEIFYCRPYLYYVSMNKVNRVLLN